MADNLFIDQVDQYYLERNRNVNDGDYEENGLLMCGVCRKPKEAIIPWVDGGEKKVPKRCDCEIAQMEEEKRQRKEDDFRRHISDTWDEYGVAELAFRKITFAQDDRRNEKLSDICERYVKEWEGMRERGMGILFYGTVGTGKTFLSYAIANALYEKQVSVAVTSFPRILNLLQNSRDRQGLIDHLQRYQLLVIDDLGTERSSSYAEEQVYNVVNARYSSGLPMIITTNLTIDEMENTSSVQYKRIYDRIIEKSIPIKMTEDSRRRENAEKNKQWAREALGLSGDSSRKASETHNEK